MPSTFGNWLSKIWALKFWEGKSVCLEGERQGLAPGDARRHFELPYDQDVQAELNVVQWEQARGSELYTFSHPEGSHDDKFWAIAMAATAAMKRGPEPYVSIIPR